MLPWPTVQPAYIQPTAWSPTPAQQVACLRKGIGLQAALGGWTATGWGESLTVQSWEDVVAFAAAHGVKLVVKP